MIINTLYDFGDTVYIKTDREQLPRMITSMKIYPQNTIFYEVTSGCVTSWHSDFELTKERNEVLAVR